MIYIAIRYGTNKERSELVFSTKEAISWIEGMKKHTVWDPITCSSLDAPIIGKVIIKFGNRYTKKTEVRRYKDNDEAIKDLMR